MLKICEIYAICRSWEPSRFYVDLSDHETDRSIILEVFINRGNFCCRPPVRGVRHFWVWVEATGGNVLWPRSKRHRHCHLRWHGQKWTAPSGGWDRWQFFPRKYPVLQGNLAFNWTTMKPFVVNIIIFIISKCFSNK